MYLLRLGSWVLYFFFRPHSGSELSIYPSYDRPAASLRLKNCKIPFTLPPPNLISVLVHVIKVLSWIRSIPRSTGTGTESVPAIDNFCYPVPVPFPYSDFPNHSVPVPVTFQHFPILSVPVTFPSMDS